MNSYTFCSYEEYNDRYFNLPEITKVHGKYKTLKAVKKAAKSVFKTFKIIQIL